MSRHGVRTRAEAAEGHDLVGHVMADIGAAEIGNAGDFAPVPGDGLLALAEIGIVGGDGAAAAEFDPRNACG